LRTLPPYYAGILGGQFNSWLRQRYGSDDVLRSAWSKGTRPLGSNVLQNSSFAAWDKSRNVPEHWNLEQHEDCRASLSRSQNLPTGALQVGIAKANSTEWHLQLNQGGFRLVEGQYYTVSFQASSAQPRSITCNVTQAHESWANLGLSRHLDLSTEWKTFSLGFVATAGDNNNARVSFAFSANSTTFHLAQVEVRPGGQMGLAPGESCSTGTVSLFQENESTPRILDRMAFLAETEKAYFDGLRSYIRKGLGCGALVTGTIVFGPLGLYAQSDMDYIDSHAYWQHPTFPGRPWDSANWLIEQKPMTDHPDQATLFRIAAERLAGKPFTLSEYNHPAPLDAQAECVPMVASFAAAQNWDGVWLFDYSGSTSAWDRQTMSGFFDIDTNPGKWGFVRAGAALFKSGWGTVDPAADATRPIPNRQGQDVTALAQLQVKYGSNLLRLLTDTSGTTYNDMLRTQIAGWRLGESGVMPQSVPLSPPSRLQWSVDTSGRGLYQASGPLGTPGGAPAGQAQVYTGHAPRFAEATEGKIRITSPSFVALTMTPLGTGQTLLITACGRCENAGMQFPPDRRTVGRNWGQAPVQIETVRGQVVVPDGNWTCHALAPDGSPKRQVPIASENGRGTLTLSPEYGTMWYLLQQR
jgi:hypothetical protein